MSFTFQNPFAYFNNPANSNPAGLGKLYIGLPDTDPITPANQIPVYAVQPDGSELAIPQPVQMTAGGVLNYNGTPIQLKLTADVYSVKATNSTGAQLYYTARSYRPDEEAINNLNAFIAGLASVNSSTSIAGQPASAIAQSIKDKITISELVRGFGSGAWEQAVNYKTLVINESVAKSGQYIIPDGQTIIFENNAAVTQSDNLTAFIASNSNWHIMGAGRILQSSLTLPTSYVAASRGILVSPTAFDWSITGNIRIMWFSGAGFEADGGSIAIGRTGYNQVSGLICENNRFDYRLLAGFPAEYTSFSNCRAIGAVEDGVYEETGNINWTGGSILYNGVGVHLKHPGSGVNPHHGMFTGTHINHNINHQLWAEEVAFGYDFTGCHFYDNDEILLPAKGGIFLDRCRGINISEGTIGCNIIPVTTGGFIDHVGYNRISGNKIDRSRSVLTGIGYDRSKLFVEDNFDINGDWFFNDFSKVFAQKRADAATPLTGQSEYNFIASLGAELFDNRESLAVSFVAPFRGMYATSVECAITASSPFLNEYVWFGRDDAGSGTYTELYRIKMVDLALGSTRAILNFFYEFAVSDGGQLNVFMAGCTPAVTYTFSAGTLITIKSQD